MITLPMGRKKNPPRIVVRPLPGDTAGLACKRTNTIELDPDIATAKDALRVIVHEAYHIADWKAGEKKVDRISREIAEVLWRHGYRLTK